MQGLWVLYLPTFLQVKFMDFEPCPQPLWVIICIKGKIAANSVRLAAGLPPLPPGGEVMELLHLHQGLLHHQLLLLQWQAFLEELHHLHQCLRVLLEPEQLSQLTLGC